MYEIKSKISFLWSRCLFFSIHLRFGQKHFPFVLFVVSSYSRVIVHWGTLNIPKYKKYISNYGKFCLIYLYFFIYIYAVTVFKACQQSCFSKSQKTDQNKWGYNRSSKYSKQLFTNFMCIGLCVILITEE